METITTLAFFIPDGMACISIQIKKYGLLKYEDSNTFRSCFNALCLLNRLTELMDKVPQKLMAALWERGQRSFEIVAPSGVNFEGKDISGQVIAHCPAQPSEGEALI